MANNNLNLPSIQELLALNPQQTVTPIDFVGAAQQGLALEDTLARRKQEQASKEQALADKIKKLKEQQGFAQTLPEADRAAFMLNPEEGLKSIYKGKEEAAKSKSASALEKEKFGYNKQLKQMELEGKKAAEASKATEADKARKMNAKMEIDRSQMLLDNIDKAISRTSPESTGWMSFAKNIPGTKSKDLASVLKTVKSNLGIDQLKMMRKASPTGASGFGQLSNKELSALENAMANLDQAQNDKDIIENLNKIRTHYANWIEIMKQDQEQNGSIQAPTMAPKSLITPNGVSYTIE